MIFSYDFLKITCNEINDFMSNGTFYLKNDRTETLPIFGYRFQDGQIAYVKINKLFSLNIVLSYIIK